MKIELLTEPMFHRYRLVVGPWNWVQFGLYNGVTEERDSVFWQNFSAYLKRQAE